MRYIKILGASGSLTSNQGTTCLQLSPDTLIDAGNVISSLGEAANNIEHIYLTHSHFDHISDIPAILDLFFTSKTRTLHLYGLKETLEVLKNSLFNRHIFPDFSEIDLVDGSGKSIEYHEIVLYQKYQINGITLMPFPTNHTVASCGYVIQKEDTSIMFTSDTGPCDEIYRILNEDLTIKTLITEVSFPSMYQKHAEESLHLTPNLLFSELKKLKREDVRILVMHVKPSFADSIAQEILEYKETPRPITILYDGDSVPYGDQEVKSSSKSIYGHYNTLLKIGIALTAEQSQVRLAEVILKSARDLTQSDAGTFYLLSDDGKFLQFQAIQNDSIAFCNQEGEKSIPWAPIPLYYDDGTENHALAAAHCALSRDLVSIKDIYSPDPQFDFHSTLAYDRQSGYYSHSMLLIPLIDFDENLIGVLQLINKLDNFGNPTAYSDDDVQVISALGSQATISITNQKLKNDFELLFESFLKTINLALDKKSPHMKGHIQRMLELTMLIANGIHQDTEFFADKRYTETELKTIEIAAMMHDIGKITTPTHIMDKARKLETIFDRIELVRLRLELLRTTSQKSIAHGFSDTEIDEAMQFLEAANYGREYFDEEKIQRIHEIANWKVMINGKEHAMLDEDEVRNLIVNKGTLTQEQRDIINHHATMSIEMLHSIQFPKKYQRVPEIAGNHHEKINGTGYPKGLKGDEISFEARILAIADIFEALTSLDRPYKKINMLSEAIQILWDMANSNDIDREICQFFYESGLYLTYAKRHMPEEYIDEVEIDFSFD